jgi:anti-sigma factor RsiW
MCCKGGFDLRDYFWGELPEADRAEAERHISGCGICASELAELKAARGVLMTLREEEPPQRIGFVSDKVFEPSPLRRWLDAFWMSGARLGFASAAMLSVAILVFAARQPKVIEKAAPVVAAVAPTAVAPQVDVKGVVDAAVKSALAEQDKKTSSLLAAAEEKHQMEERAMALKVSDYLTNVEKRLSYTRAVAMDYGSKGGQ